MVLTDVRNGQGQGDSSQIEEGVAVAQPNSVFRRARASAAGCGNLGAGKCDKRWRGEMARVVNGELQHAVGRNGQTDDCR